MTVNNTGKLSSSAVLLFPPTWSLNVGNPHLAIAMLNAVASEASEQVDLWDLNLEAAQYHHLHLSADECSRAASVGTMQAMNEEYFGVEDRMMSIAEYFNGQWNLQLGFQFNEYLHTSSVALRRSVTLNSPFTRYYREVVIPRVARINPTLIAMSIASVYQLMPSLQLCYWLRKSGFEGRIVLGGNTISRLADALQGDEWLLDLVDGLVLFQGEIPFGILLESKFDKSDWQHIPNLIWRQGECAVRNKIDHRRISNSTPTPDFGSLQIGEYWGVNYLPMLASRGCYFGKCSFCAIPYGYNPEGYAGTRRSDLVFSDILTLEARHGLHRYKFVDEALSYRTMSDLSHLLVDRGVDIEWEGYVRMESHWQDKRFVEGLANSGFRKAYFGLEVYPTKGRSSLGKSDKAENALRVLQLCYDNGIKVHLFCMFGFPGTGRLEADATVEFIMANSSMIDTVDLNAFTYARHTQVEGIERLQNSNDDLSLEFDFVGTDRNMTTSSIANSLSMEAEDVIWDAHPKMLHPIYRMVSPWKSTCNVGVGNYRNAVCA